MVSSVCLQIKGLIFFYNFFMLIINKISFRQEVFLYYMLEKQITLLKMSTVLIVKNNQKKSQHSITLMYENSNTTQIESWFLKMK